VRHETANFSDTKTRERKPHNLRYAYIEVIERAENEHRSEMAEAEIAAFAKAYAYHWNRLFDKTYVNEQCGYSKLINPKVDNIELLFHVVERLTRVEPCRCSSDMAVVPGESRTGSASQPLIISMHSAECCRASAAQLHISWLDKSGEPANEYQYVPLTS